MSFKKNFSILLLVLVCSLLISGCPDRIHDDWKERPAAPIYDDPIIFARINGSIQDDPVLQDVKINIEVNDGIVSLSGEINNAAQADQAIMHSWRVDGVKDVNNQMRIK